MTDCTEQLQAQLLQSSGPLRIEGSGSYASHFTPPPGSVIATREHTGIVSYEPTEMVVTVRAGTSLQELQAVLAEQDQQLGVECPQLASTATVGGAIAMGMSGSARPFSGAMRDYVLGVRMLNGLGQDLSFGGQVMKNVAGYDLSRLMVGSRGRLGLLLEISLRLLPCPQQCIYRVLEQPDLAAAVSFTHQLLHAAEPITGASYYQGRLHLRFAGRASTMERLQQQVGGEAESQQWWDDLQNWKMPWGGPGWRSYRRGSDPEPLGEVPWLVDWNGGLLWSGRDEPVTTGPLRDDIEQRLCQAFDPQGLFAGGLA
jgi:glycolate oxidase FAD binding subunit